MNKLLAFLAVPAVLGVCTMANAAPVINFPPPNSRTFISMYEIDSGRHVCAGVQCNLVSSTGAPLDLPPATFASDPFFESGSGRIEGREIHAFISGNVGVEIDLALRDTFTVLGSAVGPFPVTFTFSASGTASSVGTQLLFPSLTLIIGSFGIDPAFDAVPTVRPFDPVTTKVTGAAPSIFSGGGTEPISATLVYTRMVSVGEVFDLAFELSALASKGTIDLSHTAAISIEVPDGVFLSSVLVPVPEPAPRLLLALGAGGLWVLGRRRSAVRR